MAVVVTVANAGGQIVERVPLVHGRTVFRPELDAAWRRSCGDPTQQRVSDEPPSLAGVMVWGVPVVDGAPVKRRARPAVRVTMMVVGVHVVIARRVHALVHRGARNDLVWSTKIEARRTKLSARVLSTLRRVVFAAPAQSATAM